MQAGLCVHMVGASAKAWVLWGVRGGVEEWAGYKSGATVGWIGNWVSSKVAGRRREKSRVCVRRAALPFSVLYPYYSVEKGVCVGRVHKDAWGVCAQGAGGRADG
jgi:hypothetical protein